MTIHNIKVPKGRLGIDIVDSPFEDNVVIIEKIQDDSPVKHLLRVGDVITHVDGHEAIDVDDVLYRMRFREDLDKKITVSRMDQIDTLDTVQTETQNVEAARHCDNEVNQPQESENVNDTQNDTPMEFDNTESLSINTSARTDLVQEQSGASKQASLDVVDKCVNSTNGNVEPAEVDETIRKSNDSSIKNNNSSVEESPHQNSSTQKTKNNLSSYGPMETIEVPPGTLGVSIDYKTLNGKSELSVNKIQKTSPVRDKLKEKDVITHINGIEISGDFDLLKDVLLKTNDKTRSLGIRRHLRPSKSVKSKAQNSSTQKTKDNLSSYGPMETIEVPPGTLGVSIDYKTLNGKSEIIVYRIQKTSPVRDKLKEKDVITHINGIEISGDFDLLKDVLLKTNDKTRSLGIRRHLRPSKSVKSNATCAPAVVKKSDGVIENLEENSMRKKDSKIQSTESKSNRESNKAKKTSALDPDKTSCDDNSTQHSAKPQKDILFRSFASPVLHNEQDLSDQIMIEVSNFLETFSPGSIRKENGELIPQIFVHVPALDSIKAWGLDVILAKDITRSILGFLVTKMYEFSPFYGRLYPGHFITKLNGVHVDESSTFEEFCTEYLSADDNVLEAESLPLRQLISYHSGEPLTMQYIDPIIFAHAKMPKDRSIGLYLEKHELGFLVLDVGPASIFRGQIFKNDIIIFSYPISIQSFVQSLRRLKVGDMIQLCIRVPVKVDCSNVVDKKCRSEDTKKKEIIMGPLRTVKFVHGGKSLGLVLVQRSDLGGFLVLSKTEECKVKVNTGDVLIKFNKSSLQGRTVFDLISLIEKADERHQVFTVRAYQQFNETSDDRTKDDSQSLSVSSNPLQFGKMKTVILPSNPIEFECKSYDSTRMIVSNIDSEGSCLSGINRGDLINKFDGHSINTLSVDVPHPMIISTSREALIEIYPSLENEESALSNEKEDAIQQETANDEIMVISADGIANDFEANFIVNAQSPDDLNDECFESMPICYSYVVGDTISEKVANFRSKFMNTKKRKRSQRGAYDSLIEQQGSPSTVPKSIILSRNNPKFFKEEDLGDDFPQGWKKHYHKRLHGKHIDYYYFTKTGIKLRSSSEAKRFAQLLEKTNGDEAAALELFGNPR